MTRLDQIRQNHAEREGITDWYNSHWNYYKEAVQQYNEITYLLMCIDKTKELANDKGRQKARKSKAKIHAS